MSTLEFAEEAVERLSIEELPKFLRWLSQHAGGKLESLRTTDHRCAQDLAEHYEEQVQSGRAKPFNGIDVSAWPAPARESAEAMIAEWQTRHGK